MSSPITEFAPAKVNLALHVTGQRDDGYHDIDTICVFAGFGDRVEIALSREDSFDIAGPFAAALRAQRDNIVTRARDFLRAEHGASETPPVSIRLDKNLPLASGLGGGSADAAAALRGLSRLWGVTLPDDETLARRLGADIPMCLASRPLRAGGIGERVEHFPQFTALALVLVNPGVAVSTPAIFSALRQRANPPLPALDTSSGFAGLVEWMTATRNDLQPPAVRHCAEIGAALAAIEASGAAFARMSGSGATCFGIYETLATARAAATDIARRHPGWFIEASDLHPHHERRDHAAA